MEREDLEPGGLEHVGQRVRVAGDRGTGLRVACRRHLLASCHRLGVRHVDGVALDRVRTPDRTRDQAAPQLPQPTARLGDLVAQLAAEPLELGQHPLVGLVDRRNSKQHTTMLHAS